MIRIFNDTWPDTLSSILGPIGSWSVNERWDRVYGTGRQ